MEFPVPPVVQLPMALRWRVERFAPEDVRKGWIAGPTVRVVTHWTGKKTTPCAWALTKGAVRCACQSASMAKRTVGYMPMIQTDGDRVVLFVPDSVALKHAGIPFGKAIQVSRPKNPTAAYKVKQLGNDELSSTLQKTVLAKGPQDIKQFLLHLWQMPALTLHFSAEFYPSLATLSASEKQQEDAA